jgi:3',5'-cyclic AMP phosphodiesterase CpdA
MPFRIGLVTDIHNGPDTETRPGSVALGLMDQFVHEMRTRFRPDLIVDMGDRINDVSSTEDAMRISQVVSRLTSAGVPTCFLHGNHDVPNLDFATINRLLGRKADYESVDLQGLHLVLLNTQDPTFEGGGGTLSEAQLAWLEEDLRRASGPALVFSHHPLDEQDVSRHWYFPSHPDCALAVNRARARQIFARSGKVRAVFHGHMHWNHAEVIDGIPYITVGSLVEMRLTGGQPAGGYAEVTVEDGGRLRVEVRGRLPMSFVHP